MTRFKYLYLRLIFSVSNIGEFGNRLRRHPPHLQHAHVPTLNCPHLQRKLAGSSPDAGKRTVFGSLGVREVSGVSGVQTCQSSDALQHCLPHISFAKFFSFYMYVGEVLTYQNIGAYYLLNNCKLILCLNNSDLKFMIACWMLMCLC